MTDNPLVEAMARAIRLHRRRDLAFTDDQIAAAALAAIGPGSEAWDGMCLRLAHALYRFDDGEPVPEYIRNALRAALGFVA